jgi:hypothetical protein
MSKDIKDRYTKTTLNECDVAFPSPQFADKELKQTRDALGMLLHEVCSIALGHKVDDPVFLKQVIKCIYTLTCFRHKHFSKNSFSAIKQQETKRREELFFSFNNKTQYPRVLMIDMAHLLLTSRHYLRKIPFVGVHEKLFDDLRQLSVAPFSSVRKAA